MYYQYCKMHKGDLVRYVLSNFPQGFLEHNVDKVTTAKQRASFHCR